MGLFSRRREKTEEAAESAAPATTHGPWDSADKPELGNRIDLGALRIPKRTGMQVRLELERTSRIPVAVTVTLGSSAVQLQVFAAPKTSSLWDEVRPELAKSVKDAGGSVDDVPGVFGRELLAHMPVTTPGGSGTRVVRFAAVDGPRWMIRATFSGRAANEPAQATDLESIVRAAVVVRGREARAPREVLPLSLPGAEKQSEATPEAPGLAVPTRGPEMTETR